MSIQKFLHELKSSNIRIELVQDQLKIVGDRQKLTEEVLDTLKLRKAEIMRFLKNTENGFSSIGKAEKKNSYPLSSAQHRLFVLQKMNEASTAYNMPQEIYMGQTVDKEKIEGVFRQLVQRHDSFRTSFVLEDGKAMQIVHDHADFNLQELSVKRLDDREHDTAFVKPFDLENAPLLRAALVKDSANNYKLLVDAHHIVSDGVSASILKREFSMLYSGMELPSLHLSYIDYSEWENSSLQQEKIKEQEKYWLSIFNGEVPVLELPTDFTRPDVMNDEASRVRFVLTQEETTLLKKMMEENGLTLYMACLSLFAILLHKLSGQEEVIIGMPIEGRHNTDLDSVVGVFVNTLAIKTNIRPGVTLKEFLADVRTTVLDAFDNRQYPFERLVEKIGKTRHAGRNPIFDVQVNILEQGEYVNAMEEDPIGGYVHNPAIKRFDITLNVMDSKDRIAMEFQYWTKLFKSSTIEYYIKYFRVLIRSLANGLDQKIRTLRLLAQDDKEAIEQWSFGQKTGFTLTPIHRLFEQQVEKAPDKAAIVFGETVVSYHELNKRANRLAQCLINEFGVNTNDIVGIVLDRTPEAIISILAVLKAGAAFLPVDYQYPATRIHLMLDDANVKAVIYDSQLINEPKKNISFAIDQRLHGLEEAKDDPRVSIGNNDLAYVIYTSGSTGKPKGVAVAHNSISNYIQWANSYYFRNEQGANFALFTSLAFDLTLTCIFTTLLRGDQLHIYSSTTSIDKVMAGIFHPTSAINVVKLTPSHVSLLKEASFKGGNVRTVIVGGEKLTSKHIETLMDINSSVEIYNEYGPTEATVGCTVQKVSGPDDLSIGKPIDGLNIYILDQDLGFCPPGVWGEIFIGGAGVAKGYINNVESSRHRFIPDLFSGNGLMYKSGDKARWQFDGTIEYAGRNDEQVKLYGYRIELEEIENVLCQYEKAEQCAVIVYGDGDARKLCAYIVSNEAFIIDELRNYAASVLPAYMVPYHFIRIEKLPLTSNGKLDRKALVAPVLDAASYKAPTGPTEEKLVEIWSSILGVEKEKIGVSNTIFELGGHSLMVIKILVRVRSEFKVNVKVEDVFRIPTIEALAKTIERKKWLIDNTKPSEEIKGSITI